MLRRYSIRNLNQTAIEMLADIRTEQRRETGAILEDCISAYWHQIFYLVENEVVEPTSAI
jgi:hypothetical protein